MDKERSSRWRQNTARLAIVTATSLLPGPENDFNVHISNNCVDPRLVEIGQRGSISWDKVLDLRERAVKGVKELQGRPGYDLEREIDGLPKDLTGASVRLGVEYFGSGRLAYGSGIIIDRFETGMGQEVSLGLTARHILVAGDGSTACQIKVKQLQFEQCGDQPRAEWKPLTFVTSPKLDLAVFAIPSDGMVARAYGVDRVGVESAHADATADIVALGFPPIAIKGILPLETNLSGQESLVDRLEGRRCISDQMGRGSSGTGMVVKSEEGDRVDGVHAVSGMYGGCYTRIPSNVELMIKRLKAVVVGGSKQTTCSQNNMR